MSWRRFSLPAAMLTPRSDSGIGTGPVAPGANADQTAVALFDIAGTRRWNTPTRSLGAAPNARSPNILVLDTSSSPFPGSLRFGGAVSPLALTLRPNKSPHPGAFAHTH